MSKMPELIGEAILLKDKEILRLRAENEKLQSKCEFIYDGLLEAKGQAAKLRAALKQLHEAATEATNGLDFDEWWKEELDAAAAALKETGDE